MAEEEQEEPQRGGASAAQAAMQEIEERELRIIRRRRRRRRMLTIVFFVSVAVLAVTGITLTIQSNLDFSRNMIRSPEVRTGTKRFCCSNRSRFLWPPWRIGQ